MKRFTYPLLLVSISLLGCRTPLPETPVAATDADPNTGYYLMKSEFFYSGITYLSQTSDKVYTVHLLEKRGGSFGLKKGRKGKFEIVQDNISFDKIKRSLIGKAEFGSDGIFRGFAIVRLRTISLVARDHRKGEFTLQRATPQEAMKQKRKIKHPVPGVALPGA